MSSTATCANPRCTCTPCSCEECRCPGSRLGELERRVMEVVWEDSGREMSGRDVADTLPGYAYTTVATVLDRLSQKGLLRRRTTGRVVLYRATDTQGAHTAMAMHE